MNEDADKFIVAVLLQEMGPISQGEIHFAEVACRLGNMLVAVSRKGVCYLAFADDTGLLLDDVCRSFKRDWVRPGSDGLISFARQYGDGLGKPQPPDIPLDLLDLRGTGFQLLVWHALREIPAGKVASYGEIARRIGKAKAVRAVASACAANPVAVLVPCHRIVRKDGGLSGYHWGVWRKRALLAWEREGRT